ncbi:MAG: hypothetical protein WAZ64_00265, partial [Candidatus Moraniibacteriota bacterium]
MQIKILGDYVRDKTMNSMISSSPSNLHLLVLYFPPTSFFFPLPPPNPFPPYSPLLPPSLSSFSSFLILTFPFPFLPSPFSSLTHFYSSPSF